VFLGEYLKGGIDIKEVVIMKDGNVIGFSIKVADSFIHRLIGLMGKKHLLRGEGLLLKDCRQIHTFFMRITIDTVFLDRKGEVIELLPAMAPCKISPYVKNAVQVLELPEGSIERHDLQKNMLLSIVNPDIKD
jgi:uncharacterized membrane protein (UPF0127 family)